MQIIEKKLNELREYENNPRLNDNAVGVVAKSIEQFGFKVPIVVDRDNVIVAGHTRLKAARLLGMEYVPCIVADDLNEEQVKAFRLVDNKTSEFAEWDDEKLRQELDELDLTDFGFDLSDGLEEEDKKEREEISLNESISVVVECADDEEAEMIFVKLTEEGYKCHISTL